MKLKLTTKLRLKIFKYLFPKEHMALMRLMNASKGNYYLAKKYLTSK